MKITLSDIRRIIAEELELFEQGGDPTVFELIAGTKVIPVYHDVDGDQLLYVNVAGNRTNIRISKYEEGGMPVRGYFQLGDEIVRGDLREPRSTYRPDTPGDWDDPEEWHESKTPEIEEGHNKWVSRNIVLKHRGKLDVTAKLSDYDIALLNTHCPETVERYASQITSHPAIKGEYTALGEQENIEKSLHEVGYPDLAVDIVEEIIALLGEEPAGSFTFKKLRKIWQWQLEQTQKNKEKKAAEQIKYGEKPHGLERFDKNIAEIEKYLDLKDEQILGAIQHAADGRIAVKGGVISFNEGIDRIIDEEIAAYMAEAEGACAKRKTQ